MVQKRPRNLKSSAEAFKAVVLAIVLSATISLGPASAQGLNAEESNKLNLIEQNLFFKNYDDDSAEARIARIEKRVFGEPAEGSLSARMANILQVAKPLDKPQTPRNQPASNTPRQPTPEQQQQEQQASQEDAADRARQRAMAARDEEINQMFADAVRLWKERKGNDALEKFEQVVRLAPDNAEAHFSLGVIYEAQHNYTEALGSYKRAADIDPQKREYKEAVNLVEKKAVVKDQDDGKKLELRMLAENASGAYRRGEFISALDLYKQLDRKAPNQALVKYNIATIYLAMKSPVQALDFFRQARKLKPEDQNYQKAVAQLEGNLQAEESERLNAERAWQNQNQDQSQNQNQNQNSQRNQNQSRNNNNNQNNNNQNNSNSNNNNNQNSNGNGLLGGDKNAPPPSAAFGILAKSNKSGVLVTTIGIASRAARGGLQRGDVIRAIDGEVIKSVNQFQQIMNGKRPGQSLQLMIERKGAIGQVIL
ncbi:hypothetical protein BH11CYA1_BH11CYA1_23110 [soil metagenome]